MTKLVTFIGVLIAISGVLFLTQYKSLPVSNERFSFENAKQAHETHLAELAVLEAKRLAILNPVEEEIVEAAPVELVALTTPQLVNGHELYQKCIVCHGRSGEGRLSQNSPAIGGQHEWYIISSLRDMKEGRRINAVMNPFLRPLDEEDFKDLAAYISLLPWKGGVSK